MSEMRAYCGLSCLTCPIHLATLEVNKEEQKNKRSEISRLMREQYGMNFSPEEITDCDGCRTKTDRIFTGCRTCEIRKCAIEKNVENCAFCSDYACEKLSAFLAKESGAKEYLEKVRHCIK